MISEGLVLHYYYFNLIVKSFYNLLWGLSFKQDKNKCPDNITNIISIDKIDSLPGVGK